MGVQFTSVRGQNDRVSISANELLKKGGQTTPPRPPTIQFYIKQNEISYYCGFYLESWIPRKSEI